MELDRSSLAVVYSNGTILWVPPATMTVRCTKESEDSDDSRAAKCSLVFGSWVHDATKFNIQFLGKAEADIDWFDSSVEVTENSAVRNEKHYPCCKEPYADLTFTIGIKEK